MSEQNMGIPYSEWVNQLPTDVSIEVPIDATLDADTVQITLGYAGYPESADEEAIRIYDTGDLDGLVRFVQEMNADIFGDEAVGFDRQVGGTHYQELAIQPMEYSYANDLNALQHSIIKYATRAGTKLSEDTQKEIKKIIHCAELWLQLIDKYGDKNLKT